MNATRTKSCAAAKGGSDCVGASALSAGTFWKQLGDEDKDVEIEGDDRRDDVSPPPASRKAVVVSRQDRDRQDDQGNDPNTDPRSESFDREEDEPRHARQHGGGQEHRRP